MLKVVAKLYIKPECIADAIKLYDKFIDITRAEDGNISYELYQDVEDETLFTFIETWASREACDKHLNAPHFLEILPIEETFLVEGTELNISMLKLIK